MKKKFPTVALREIAKLVKREVVVRDDVTYRQAGVRLWGGGAYERESIRGSDTRYKSFYRIHTNDFIVNKIWARNGSISMVPEQLDGCHVSSEFPTFDLDPERIDPDWLGWLTKTTYLWNQFSEKSHGTSGKNRIQPEKVLSAQIPLPSLSRQKEILCFLGSLSKDSKQL